MSNKLSIHEKARRWWPLALLAAVALVLAVEVNTARAAVSEGDSLGDYCESYKLLETSGDLQAWRCVARQWFRDLTGYCVWIIFTEDGKPVDGIPVSKSCPRGSSEHNDRVNLGHGDHIAAVYIDQDDHAKPDLKLYCVSPLGTYAGQIDQALLDTVPHPPAADTLVKTFDACSYPVNLYALTTGEFQLNFGPDAEGHTAVMVFKGLPPSDIYFYDIHLTD